MFRCLLLISVIITSQPAGKMNAQNKPFDWQGHRGCRGLMPENTIPAMLKALDLGVTTLEMDAVITKDNEVVLSHEPFFNHEITTKPDGTFVDEAEETKLNIYQMTYAEVKRYDIGTKPHPRFPQQHKMRAAKPRLADVIDLAEAHATANARPLPFYNIETKSKPETDNVYHPQPAAFVELIMKIIKDKGIEDRTIIQSFDIRTLQYLHIKYPMIKTALLVEDYDKTPLDKQLKTLGFIPSIYSPDHSLVTPALGVDGIITDYPNLIF